MVGHVSLLFTQIVQSRIVKNFFFQQMFSKAEIENIVEHLKPIPIEQWGSHEWLKQMIGIEKINVQAHVEASSNKFESVVDCIKTHDKFEVLVHELIATDMCLNNMFSKFKSKLPQQAFARVFVVERSLSTLLNLLGFVVFKPESLSSEGLLPLIDFCAAKLAQLTKMDVGDIDPTKEQDPLLPKFQICFGALSIIWCIACATPDPGFPISVTKRLVNEDDLIPTLCELVIKQPWRTIRKGKVLKWGDNALMELEKKDALRVCKPEAHAWTAIQQLLEPRCLELTNWNDSRRESLLHVEGMLSEVLIDQLPPLQSLKRALQYLRVNIPPPPKFQAIIEQIPPMKEEFDRNWDWNSLSDKCFNKYFKTSPQQAQAELQMISDYLSIFANLEGQ